jgi:hypothetical protein
VNTFLRFVVSFILAVLLALGLARLVGGPDTFKDGGDVGVDGGSGT